MQKSRHQYGRMPRDIFYSGRVLAKKHNRLRIARIIFMFGFGISMLVFLIVFLRSMLITALSF